MSINVAGEKIVYDILIKKGLTPEGACGLIGNLEAESDGFYSNRVEYLCISRLKQAGKVYTDETYTAAVDSGKISRAEFLNPLPGKQYGYGLAQWTSPSRKAGLYDLCKKKGVSISDFDAQVEFLLFELETIYTSVLHVLKTTHSIREASDIVLKKFENPADQSSAHCASRANRGYTFQAMYAASAPVPVKDRLRSEVVKLAQSWLGKNEADGSYKSIIDIYNSYKGTFPRGVKMLYGWAWCACTWSAIAIKLGYTDIMPIEIGVEELVKRAKDMGCWVENDAYVPKPADAIIYDWDDNGVGDCTGYSDHIGTVEKVEGNTITVIEGNCNNRVQRRVIQANARYIRGYVTPKYSDTTDVVITEKKEGLQKGDAGADVKVMQQMLIACGYSCGSAGADGDFGSNTEKAVKKFQKAHNLEQSGQYDVATHKALTAAYSAQKQPEKDEAKESSNRMVKVSIPDLNIRRGAGIGYEATGFTTGIGTFTVTEIKKGAINSSGTLGSWGRLLSGAGWICLSIEGVKLI